MARELDVSSIVPPTVPCPGTPLPSTGSLGLVPPLRRLLLSAPTPRRPFRVTSFPRSAVPPLRAETTRSPRFLGSPLCMRPALRPRRGRAFARCCRRQSPTAAALSVFCFAYEAQSHGPYTRCLRFASTVTRGHARLASSWLSPWPAGLDTRGAPKRGFSFGSTHRILLSQALAWRTKDAKMNLYFCVFAPLRLCVKISQWAWLTPMPRLPVKFLSFSRAFEHQTARPYARPSARTSSIFSWNALQSSLAAMAAPMRSISSIVIVIGASRWK